MRRIPAGPVSADVRIMLLCAAVLLAAKPAAADTGRERPGDTATSIGDLRFHASAVAYRHGEREARAEFSIRVPYRQIQFLPEVDHFAAKLRLTVELWNASGKRAGYLQREAILQCTDVTATRDSLLGEIYSVGVPAPAGRYTFKVLVEDMNVARQGLVYTMRKQKRQGQVEGSIDMGTWLFRNPTLSGLEFSWEIRERDGATPFGKGPYEVMPNPSAYYGHHQEVVSVYYEVYDEDPPPAGRSYSLEALVLSSAGDTLFTSVDSLRVSEGTAWPHALAVDASLFPSGRYRMILTLEDDGRRALAKSQGEFDILWSLESWGSESADLYEVTATTLLPTDSVLVFRDLPMGEKEQWIERLWRAADPTPDTGDNERRDEFRRRVDFANTHYTVIARGMFADRGRAYIRYGEPDDIKVERIPVADKTLGYALENQIPKSSRQDLTDTRSGVADMRAYEIWTYDKHGHELVQHFGMNEITSGIKFVFVDEHGWGEYTLKYSSTTSMH